jgi:hypothetical protein
MLKTIFTYPWDLHDDGIDRALDMIQNAANLNGVSLAFAYHVATFFLPHNPRRKIHFGEDGIVLFVPDAKHWSQVKIRPRVSGLVQGADWLRRIIDKIKNRGLYLTAWTVFFYNHYLARTYPDCAKRDALGNANLAQLCPANPDVRQYAKALATDIVMSYKPDAIYLESLCYLPFSYGFLGTKVLTPISPRAEFLLGLCFCPHCLKAASEGLETDKFKDDVARWLEGDLARMPADEGRAPADQDWQNTAFDSRLQHYLAARADVASSLYEEIVQIVKPSGVVKVESDFASLEEMPVSGLHPGRINKVTDRLGVGVPERADQVQARRATLKGQKKLVANIQPDHVKSRDSILQTLRTTNAAGVDGYTFYNYGLIRVGQLRWIGEACREVLS